MLKSLEVENAKPRDKAYKLADGLGLHLLVQPTGSKLWRFRYRFMGKEKSHQLFRTVNGSQVQGRIALLVLGSNIRPAAEQ